jgi:AraC family transcriptional regulator
MTLRYAGMGSAHALRLQIGVSSIPSLGRVPLLVDDSTNFDDKTGATSPSRSSQAMGCEELPKLISAAVAALDCDRATAKACLQRAVELLSVTYEGRPVQATACIRGGLAPWQRKVVTAYIAANLGSTIRVSDLARVARLSVGHFFRAFRESFGEPPLAHVARRRSQRAQSLMLSSQASLSQIGLDCGMHDQSHFTRVFRRFVGINPGVWRRQFSAGDANTTVEKSASKATEDLTTVQYGSRRTRHDES